MFITGCVVSVLKVARSRRTEGTCSVQAAVLGTDISSIRPRFTPDFSKCGKIPRPRSGISVGDASKRTACCGSKTAVSRVIWVRFQLVKCNLETVLNDENTVMVHVLPYTDFEQVKYEMLQVQYVDLSDG